MEKLTLILESQLAADLGLTLFHVTWQGLVLLGVYFLGIRFLSSAKQKVNFGLGILFSQLIISVVTFVYFQKTNDASAMEANRGALALSTSWIDRVQLMSPWLFGGWLVGFSFLAIKNIGGFSYVQWLKQTPSVSISPRLSDAWDKLDGTIAEIGKNIELKQSLKASTAMVIGTFKPVILFPTAWIGQMGIEQLELILAHELAHIKRNDFFINTLQVIVESLYFFHPVYWFIGNEIKHYRELACDEQVVEWTGKEVLLAKTLAQIQVQESKAPFAMAFGKKRMTTLNRIEKLLGYEKRNTKSKLIAVFLMSFAVSAFAFQPILQKELETEADNEPFVTEAELIEPMKEKLELTAITVQAVDTVGPSSKTTTYVTESKRVRITTDKSNVEIDESGIRVNGRKLKFSAQEEQDFKNNWKGLQQSQKDLKAVSQKMSAEAHQMSKVHSEMAVDIQFNPSNDPEFKEYLAQVAKYGKEIGAVGVKMGLEIADLDKNDADYQKKVEDVMAKYEPQMKEKEASMKDLEPKMKAWEQNMEEQGKLYEKQLEGPLQEIEKGMKIHEEAMEQAADKMSNFQERLFNMLPKEVQDDLESSEHFNYNYMHPPMPPAPEAIPPRVLKSDPPNPLSPPPPPTIKD